MRSKSWLYWIVVWSLLLNLLPPGEPSPIRAQADGGPDASAELRVYLPFVQGEGTDSDPATEPEGADTSGFIFTVDPANATVLVPDRMANENGVGAVHASSTPRKLDSTTELVQASFRYAFQPDNRLVIWASFTNVITDAALLQPFTFAVNPATANIVSSLEPTITSADLGGDDRLAPNETTAELRFEVTHRNQPFTYIVDAYAVVQPQEQSAPVAVNDRYEMDEDTVLTVAAPGVLANDSDGDGDALTSVLVTDVTNGLLTLNADGSFSYTPADGFSGTDSFHYQATDGLAVSVSATVTLTVRSVGICRTYTTDADFDVGRYINVVHSVPGQLQLDDTASAFNFIWVAISTKGTVVKMDAETGVVLGEYRTAPEGQPTNPSRTTVDLNGNVWATNRDGNSVVQIGLLENNQCVDRNGNGQIDTSTELDDFLPWTNTGGADTNGGITTAQDECILHYTSVSSSGTRHVSVTPQNDIWVSGTGNRVFDLLDGKTGQIKRTEGSVGYGGYGGLIDKNGVIWSARPLLRWDTDNPLTGANGGNWTGYEHDSYGLCIDSQGNVWNTALSGDQIRKFAPDGTLLGTFSHGFTNAQGCVVGQNDDVWVAHGGEGDPTIGHLKNDGTFVGNVSIPAGATGVAADAAGKIWSTNYSGRTVSRIDPAAGPIGADGITPIGAVDFTSGDLGGILYNYSDMTGSTLTGLPTTGAWMTIFDSGVAGAAWGTLSWAADQWGDGVLAITVAGSEDGVTFGSPVTVVDGANLTIPNGRYLRISAQFDRATTGESPVLYDLTACTADATPDNTRPIAVDDHYTAEVGQVLTVPALGILSNDSDSDSDALTATLVDDAQNGTVLLNPDGSFVYTPTLGFAGTDSFTYRASDGQLASAVATVTLTVISTNRPPVAVDDSYILTIDNTAVDEFVLDPRFQSEKFADIPFAGPLAIAPEDSPFGNYLYVAEAVREEGGDLDYIYRIDLASRQVSEFYTLPTEADPIWMTFGPGAPYTTDLYISANNRDGGQPGDAGGSIIYLEPDPSINGERFLSSPPPFMVLSEPGALLFGQWGGFGSDLFVRNSSDPPYDIARIFPNGARGSLVTLNPNHGPTFGMEWGPGGEWGTDLYVLGQPNGDDIGIIDAAGNVTRFLSMPGKSFGVIMFAPPGPFGQDMYVTAILDDNQMSIFRVTSTGVATELAHGFAGISIFPSIPVALPTVDGLAFSNDDQSLFVSDTNSNAVYRIFASNIIIGNVLDNDFDPDGDPLTAIQVTDVSTGTVTFNEDGNFTYVPPATFDGDANFTYKANDGQLDSNVATVTIQVQLNATVPNVTCTDQGSAEASLLAANLTVGTIASQSSDFVPTGSVISQSPAAGTVVAPGTSIDLVIAGGPVPAPIGGPAQVQFVLPTANSHDAGLQQNLTVALTGAISPTTVSTETIFTHSGFQAPIDGLFTFCGNSTQFDPHNTFFPGELIETSITTGVETNASPLVQPLVWRFRTAVTEGVGTFINGGQRLGTAQSWAAALGDLDSDGDLDAFVGNWSAEADQVWLNDGTGSFSDSNQRLGESWTRAVALGDLDNDGDLDAFAAMNETRANQVWFNNGSGIFSNSGQSLSNASTYGVVLGDVDGDGDLDAVVANCGSCQTNSPRPSRVWLNNGDGIFDSGLDIGTTHSPAVDLGDIDNDGDLDAFFTNWDGRPNEVWLNDGTGLFTDSGQRLGNSDSWSVKLGDLDNDGDLDAFVANKGGPPSGTPMQQPNAIWLNDGNGIFTDSGQRLGNGTSLWVELGDLDGDGDLDAFDANYTFPGEPNQVWLNDGSGQFTSNGQTIGNLRSAVSVLGDVDGDGDLDAFIANIQGTANEVWFNESGPSSNNPPSVFDETYVTDEGITLTMPAPGILTRANDPDGDPLTAILVSGPTNGILALNPDGSFTYTPNPNFTGSDTFTYKANDGTLDSNVATVTTTVHPVNDAPVAVDDAYSMNAADTLVVAAPGPLGNDSDPDGDPLILLPVNGPATGTLFLTASGAFTYTPPSAAFDGVVSFQYKAGDGQLESNIATVTMTITASTMNQPPTLTSTPPTSVTQGELYTYAVTATDPDVGDLLTFSLDVAPTGMAIDAATGLIEWTPAASQVGDHNVTVRVDDGNGGFATQSFVVTVRSGNRPPVATDDLLSVPQNTTFNYAGAGVLANDSDPDGDSLTARLVGTPVNGTVELAAGGAFTYTPPSAAFVGVATFTYVANDGLLDSNVATVTINVTAEVVTVPNVVGLPQANAQNTLITAGLAVGIITSEASATVPAGAVIRQNPPAGASVNLATPVDLVISSGPPATLVAITITPAILTLAVGETGQLTAIGSYSNGATQDLTSAVTWQSDNTAVATVAANGAVSAVTVGDTTVSAALDGVTGAADVSVIDSAVTELKLVYESALLLTNQQQAYQAFAIFGDGTSRNVTGSALWSSSTSAVAVISPVGVATTLGGGTTTIAAQFSGVSDSMVLTVQPRISDNTPPTAAITTPEEQAEITTFTDIVGTATDSDFHKYVVAFAPVGESNFTILAEGTNPVVDGVLATLDPTQLLNDLYTIQLTVYDQAGNITFDERIVQVAGDQKVGNFTLAFADVNIPLACLPLTVNRVYDSRDKRQGDFGVGWRLDVQTVQLRESRQQGSGWRQDAVEVPIIGGFPILTYYLNEDAAHKISIVLPDGHVEEFDPVPSNVEQPFQPIQEIDLNYVARPSTLGTLRAEKSQALLISGDVGPVDFFVQADAEIYNPRLYTYTAPDGTIFTIDKVDGVQSVQCLNGPTLTFTPDGITHSLGQGIDFVRDGQGRITQVIDPNGGVHRYEYDANGDLRAYHDATDAATRFTYNYTHGLLDIVDPNGVRAIRNEYDDDGRLIAHTDANGNGIDYIHDLAARTETVVDRRGNSTVYEYDERGNVLRSTDALGNATTYTYDAFDNEISVTDPLGNTTTREYVRGNVTLERDPLGNETSFTYTSLNRVASITDPKGNVTNNSYDTNGNLTHIVAPLGSNTTNTYDTGGAITFGSNSLLSTTDALGNTTRFEYDGSFSHVLRQIDAQGNVTAFTYDNYGNQLTQTVTRTDGTGNPVAVTTRFVYDANNRLIETIDPAGNSSFTEYNAAGQQTATVDKAGNRTEYAYDPAGNLIRTTYADGTSERSTYDAEGNLLTSTDRGGRTTTYEYDALNRLVRTVYADGSATSTTYDVAGRVTATTDERGNTTSFAYDAAGRRARVTDALGHETSFTYDANGNQSSFTDANGHTTTFEYDALNRRTRTLFHDGSSTSTTYDVLGRRVAETDQAGVTTQFGYDELGQLVSVTDALNQVTRYDYDEVGNRISQTDANDHTTTWAYDDLGRPLSRTLPLGMGESFTYDASGNLLSKTDFNGATISYVYDDNNRLLRKTLPDGSQVAYTYTNTGLPATVTDARGVTTYSYDSRDRLLEQRNPDGAFLRYSYDAAGNRTSVTTPAGTVGYTFDVLNRLATVTDAAGGVTTYRYDNVGNRAAVFYPNDTAATYTYDTLNRLTRLENAHASGTLISAYDYTLGPTGNRVRVVENSGRTVDYSYDALYRLTAEAITDAIAIDQLIGYTYDAVGNRLTKTVDAGGAIDVTTYSYDANDRLLSEEGNSYSYDANGNTLSQSNATGATSYSYDAENHLTAAQTPTDTITYAYDADGIRVAATVNSATGAGTTTYLVDKNRAYAQVLEERDNGGALVVSYTYGDDLISQHRGGSTAYYHYDGLGSTRALSDDSGAVTDGYTYEAFGTLIGSTGSTVNNYLFTGEQYDPNVGFYYLRARYYNPHVARFINQDPFSGSTFDPRTLHKYLYANGNPVDNIDPSGLFTLSEVSVTSVIQSIVTTARPIIGAIRFIEKAEDTVAFFLMSIELGRIFLFPEETPGGVKYSGKVKGFALSIEATMKNIMFSASDDGGSISAGLEFGPPLQVIASGSSSTNSFKLTRRIDLNVEVQAGISTQLRQGIATQKEVSVALKADLNLCRSCSYVKALLRHNVGKYVTLPTFSVETQLLGVTMNNEGLFVNSLGIDGQVWP